jgi:hypothetical protein
MGFSFWAQMGARRDERHDTLNIWHSYWYILNYSMCDTRAILDYRYTKWIWVGVGEHLLSCELWVVVIALCSLSLHSWLLLNCIISLGFGMGKRHQMYKVCNVGTHEVCCWLWRYGWRHKSFQALQKKRGIYGRAQYYSHIQENSFIKQCPLHLFVVWVS